jgi:dUTP pyrophosphatase
MSVTVIKLPHFHETWKLPTRATDKSAGYDLQSVEGVILNPGERMLIKTGLVMIIQSGFEGQIRPRSGLALKHGITVLNAPGTIDSDYEGEIKVLLINHGDEAYSIREGDRIAQIVFAPVSNVVLRDNDKLPHSIRHTLVIEKEKEKEETEKPKKRPRKDGFGSTGK